MILWIKSFVHNCLVHPLMQFLPAQVGTELHDRNANWAFGLERHDEIALESNLIPKHTKRKDSNE